MFDSQEYLFTQFDLPMNTLQLPPDIVYQDINSSRSVSPPPIEMELDVKVIKDLKDAINTIQRIDGKHEVIFEPSNHTEKMCKKLVKLVSGIKVLQLHFEFILDIINSISDEEIPEIVKRYDPLSRYSKPITKKNDLCLVAISHSFDVIMHYLLSEIEKVTDNFFASNDDGSVEVKNDKETLSHVQIIVSKLETILVYFPEAVILEPDDIFAQKKTSEIWKQLQEGCETVTVADKETLKAQLKPLRTFLVVSNAILYRSQKSETKTFKDRFLIALSVVYYSTQKEKAEHHSSLYRAAPKMESAFLVWQFIERGWFKEIMKLTLPTMDYDKKIYLGRMFPIIDRETVLKEYEEGSSSKFVESTFVPPDLTSKKEQVIESIFKKNKESVKVRIISPFPLVIQETSSEKARAMAMEAVNKVKEFFNSDKPTVTESDGIIIHVHGGGFTSGSSSSHRSYLYKWARSMNKIIFSIDYRLAPDHPYPAAPDDVWQAYNWIVNYAEPILGIKTKKVILAGDSAGGNLIVSLCLRLAKNGLKMPDGCWLAYPALNLFPRRFAPSYFLAVEDPFLPYSMLDLCIKAYIPDEFQPRMDPFLSPVIVEDHLLEKLPPLRIMTGSNDPLHDDNWRFLQRMKKLGKDIKMSVYDNMPHGFISFDMIDNYKVILEGTCKMILELFGETPIEPRSPEKRKMTY